MNKTNIRPLRGRELSHSDLLQTFDLSEVRGGNKNKPSYTPDFECLIFDFECLMFNYEFN